MKEFKICYSEDKNHNLFYDILPVKFNRVNKRCYCALDNDLLISTVLLKLTEKYIYISEMTNSYKNILGEYNIRFQGSELNKKKNQCCLQVYQQIKVRSLYKLIVKSSKYYFSYSIKSTLSNKLSK